MKHFLSLTYVILRRQETNNNIKRTQEAVIVLSN